LPLIQREVLVLVCVLGTPYEEAAEICGCEVGTIKSRIHRARAGLLNELGENSARAAVRHIGDPDASTMHRRSSAA
jgi:RNA polymerase sigma-70 factor (ECF subfamily)